MRLDEVAADRNVEFAWKPFSVRALMQEMNNVPFVGKPAKERYMWRDLERRAESYGIPIVLPVEYPLKQFDLANRVAIVAEQEGWCAEYVQNAYKLWFQHGLPAGRDDNLAESLAAVGQEPRRVLELARSESIEEAYDSATAAARDLGVFGSPSFVVDGRELFWGDDRLEDAIDFALRDE